MRNSDKINDDAAFGIKAVELKLQEFALKLREQNLELQQDIIKKQQEMSEVERQLQLKKAGLNK